MTKKQFVKRISDMFEADRDEANVLNWEWGLSDEYRTSTRFELVSRYQFDAEEFVSGIYGSTSEVLLCLVTGIEWDSYEGVYPDEIHWAAAVRSYCTWECKILAVTGRLEEGGEITFGYKDVTGAFI